MADSYVPAELEATIVVLRKKLADAEAERDRLRAAIIDALGYGADYLVAVLCTSRTVDAQFAREFADRIEEMAEGVTGVTEYEKGSLDRVGDALRDARETLGQLDGSGDIGGLAARLTEAGDVVNYRGRQYEVHAHQVVPITDGTLAVSLRLVPAGGVDPTSPTYDPDEYGVRRREDMDDSTRASLERGMAQAAAGQLVSLGDFAQYADEMCTSGGHEDIPAVGDALTDETEEGPNDVRYPYCDECLNALGPDYKPRLWQGSSASAGEPPTRERRAITHASADADQEPEPIRHLRELAEDAAERATPSPDRIMAALQSIRAVVGDDELMRCLQTMELDGGDDEQSDTNEQAGVLSGDAVDAPTVLEGDQADDAAGLGYEQRAGAGEAPARGEMGEGVRGEP